MNKLAIWVLRAGIFGTFAGHGTLALMGNEKWLPYLELVGISGSIAFKVMFIIGIIDWVVALSVILRPSKYILMYAFIWALCTALVRPLSGEPWLAFVERGANWAAPLALYFTLYPIKERLVNIVNNR
ncbi:MAG: hypothetical protein DHS20C17_29840 [Cyclobacteriaceae bacterium]|nr:MAG: hypothetical protein DHS20C17_29840 [Cyclobacteriaceae bacterium]